MQQLTKHPRHDETSCTLFTLISHQHSKRASNLQFLLLITLTTTTHTYTTVSNPQLHPPRFLCYLPCSVPSCSLGISNHSHIHYCLQSLSIVLVSCLLFCYLTMLRNDLSCSLGINNHIHKRRLTYLHYYLLRPCLVLLVSSALLPHYVKKSPLLFLRHQQPPIQYTYLRYCLQPLIFVLLVSSPSFCLAVSRCSNAKMKF